MLSHLGRVFKHFQLNLETFPLSLKKKNRMLSTSLPPQTTSTLLPVNFALPNKEWLREQLVGKKLSEIRTPVLVVDRTIVEKNTQQMRETARKLGVGLRVHIKTHKTIEGTELQLGEGVTGIVVSTMAEAHYLINSSLVTSGQLQDVILGIPISSDKLAEAHELSRRIPRFHVLVDHIATLEAIESYCLAHTEKGSNKIKFSVWLKVDCGYHRAGVSTALPNSLHLAQRIHTSPHATFQGLYTHSGQSYDSTSPLESLEHLHQERDLSLSFRETLLASGIPVPQISIGATPSSTAAAYEIGAGEDLSESAKSRWEGVTEIHAGNYIFMDRQQIQTRSASGGESGCAATVLTRVLSVYPDRGTLLIDAGALALSKDTTPQGGFGHVVGTGDKESGEGGWTLVKISQEHGIVEGPRTEGEWEHVKIGEVVRVVPNHSCLTTAGHPFYVVVEGGDREFEAGGVRFKNREAEEEELVVVDVWVPVRGW